MKWLMFCAAFFVNFSLFSQMKFEKGIQFQANVKTNFEKVDLINMGSSGLMFIREQLNFRDEIENFSIVKLDSNLNQEWSNKIKFDKRLKYINYSNNVFFTYFIFNANKYTDYEVIKVNNVNGDYQQFNFKVVSGIDFISSVLSWQNKLLIQGKSDGKNVLEWVDLIEGTSVVLPQITFKNTEIEDIELLYDLKQIAVLISNNCETKLLIYDFSGILLKSEVLSSAKKSDHVLINGIFVLDQNNLIINGQYSNYCGQYSNGIYFKNLNSKDSIRYMAYDYYDNLFSNLRPKNKLKSDLRLERNREMGKNVNQRLKLNPMHSFVENRELVNIGVNWIDKTANNRIGSNTLYNFLGTNYNYNSSNINISNLLICTIDANGMVNWDFNLDMNNLEKKINNIDFSIFNSSDSMSVIYLDQFRILKKCIYKKTNEVKNSELTFEPKDRERILGFMLKKWYGNFFLLYGEQMNYLPDGDSKQVYFINKYSQ